MGQMFWTRRESGLVDWSYSEDVVNSTLMDDVAFTPHRVFSPGVTDSARQETARRPATFQVAPLACPDNCTFGQVAGQRTAVLVCVAFKQHPGAFRVVQSLSHFGI
jgi:hypothetical protein